MIDYLEKFEKIVEIGNLTKASEVLHITQPALTIAIQQLEKRLGTQLLIRGKTGVIPTNTGKLVYEFSKKFKGDFRNLENQILDLKKESDENISVGMIDNVGNIFLTKVYREIRSKNPNIKLSLVINPTGNILQKIKNNELDFGIITKVENLSEHSLFQSKLADEELILVASKKVFDEWQQNPENLSLVSYNQESNTHKIIVESLSKSKLKANFISYSSNPQFILEMVKENIGIGVLPKNLVIELLGDSLTEIKLPSLKIKRELILVYNKDKYLTNLQKEIIIMLKKEYQKLA